MRTKTASHTWPVGRRAVLKAGLALTAYGLAAPAPIRALAEQPVKVGIVEPLTGAYAALAEAEVTGARLGIDEINRGGGVLGRPVELSVADFANDITAGVEKTRELIERDRVDFVTGNVNSAVALAMTKVTAEMRKLHIVTGAHIDEITGSLCSWNVFRICKSITMEVNAIADTLVEKFGKRWHFLTPDYIYGRSLQAAFERKLHQHGGKSAASMLPIGTHDYSRALSDAATYQPQVLVDLMGGEDQANSCGRSCAPASRKTWPSAGRCSSWRAFWRSPTRRGSAGGPWNGGGIGLTCRKSRRSTPRSAAAPAKQQARAIGSAMPPCARSCRLPTRKNRWIRSCSPARCKDTHCPPTSRSTLIAHSSAIATMNS